MLIGTGPPGTFTPELAPGQVTLPESQV